MNRFNRVTAIFIQLQSKKIVKAKEIADRFDVSLRTIYRDIQTLAEAGVPIASEAGVGYSLIEGYRLPPVMFTKQEVTAFLTAEKFVEKFTDTVIDTHFKSGMMKIRAILQNTEKELLETIENQIEVVRRNTFLQNEKNSGSLEVFIESISEQKALKIQYHTFYSDEIKDRIIEPIGIFFALNFWHTIAYCELRKDYRDFRLDRILRIEKTKHSFKQKHPSVKEYLQKVTEEQAMEKVVIRVEKDIVRYLQGQKYYYGLIDEKAIGDGVQMTFLTSSIEFFIRWFMMFADKAEIMSPKSLKNELSTILTLVKKKNKLNI